MTHETFGTKIDEDQFHLPASNATVSYCTDCRRRLIYLVLSFCTKSLLYITPQPPIHSFIYLFGVATLAGLAILFPVGRERIDRIFGI
jgi:hypothetical protein